MRLAGAAALVTGAFGFVGGAMVEALLAAGASVCAVGRGASRRRDRFGERPGLRFVEADVCEALPVEGPVDLVVHAASAANPARYVADPWSAIGPNVFGTRLLLELARERRSRAFLFLSSAEVYGAVPDERQPIRESEPGAVDPLAARSSYAEAKRMGEALCAAWHRRHGVPAVVARLFHTYGPGMSLGDGRVFSDFVADAVAGREIVLKGDGLDRRAFCHRDDAVSGLMRLLESGKAGEAYNVGNDDAAATTGELAERIRLLFPGRVPGVRRERGAAASGAVRAALPDTAKLRALGWAPRVGLDEGFRRTVESFL